MPGSIGLHLVASQVDLTTRRLGRLAAYLLRFGLVCGLRTYWTLRVLRRLNLLGPVATVRIPQSRTAILVRRRTADLEAFEKVFVEAEYALPPAVALPDPELIIDGGAHAGFASIYYANRYPAARIVAIEPEKRNFAMLEANTRQYANIDALRAAIWSASGELRIENPDDDTDAFRVGHGGTVGGVVPALTIDDIRESAGATHIDIVKLDIEGAEKEVFSAQCAEWLGRVRVLVVELHDYIHAGCSKAFYTAVCRYEFDHYVKGENVVVAMSGPAPSAGERP